MRMKYSLLTMCVAIAAILIQTTPIADAAAVAVAAEAVAVVVGAVVAAVSRGGGSHAAQSRSSSCRSSGRVPATPVLRDRWHAIFPAVSGYSPGPGHRREAFRVHPLECFRPSAGSCSETPQLPGQERHVPAAAAFATAASRPGSRRSRSSLGNSAAQLPSGVSRPSAANRPSTCLRVPAAVSVSNRSGTGPRRSRWCRSGRRSW